MRRILSAIAIGAGVLFAGSAATASDRNVAAVTDISAEKQKKPRAGKSSERTPTVAARRGWFDPSLGPDGKPYPNPYPPGTCSIDQGYGRFTTCDFHE